MANKKYIDDYAFSEPGNKKSKVVYVGEYYYRFNIAEEAFPKFRLMMIGAVALEALLFIAMGIIDSGGMSSIYIALPYAISFLPIFLSAICLCDIFDSKRLMTRKIYEIGVKRLRNATVATLIFSAAVFLGSVVYLVVAGFSVGQLIFTILNAALGALCYLYMGLQGKTEVEKVKNVRHTIETHGIAGDEAQNGQNKT